MDFRVALERICAVVEEAKSAALEPGRAIFALGRIAEIADQAISKLATEKPPTEPAA